HERKFDYNGLPLPHAYDVEVRRLLNDEFYVTGKYAIDEEGRYKELQTDRIITAHTPRGLQPFVILEPTKHSTYVEFEAWPPIYAHLRNKLVRRFKLRQADGVQAIKTFVSRLTVATPLDITSNIDSLHDFSVVTDGEDDPNKLYDAFEVFKRIVRRWGGELDMNGFDVRVVDRIGETTDALLYEKKNITEFVDEESIKDIVTRVHGKATWTEQVEDGDDIEHTITETVHSPLIDAYNGYIFERQYENNDVRTPEAMRNWLALKFSTDHIDKPRRQISLKTNVIGGEEVNFGDT